jgi:hypothetical protein
MQSAFYYELSRRLGTAMEKEAAEIAVGGCVSDPGTSVDAVAMLYRERVGYLQGLKRAFQIADDIERGKES